MRIQFRIHYQTQWGERLAITGSSEELGNWDRPNSLALTYQGEGFWGATLEISRLQPSLSYKYLLIDENSGQVVEEWGQSRTLELPMDAEAFLAVQDAWRMIRHDENALYTSAFQDAIFQVGRFRPLPADRQPGQVLVRFQMRAPRVDAGEQLCILGSLPELGGWNPKKPLLMGNTDHPLWLGSVASLPAQPFNYKYGIYDLRKGRVKYLESGDNRRSFIPNRIEQFVISDEYFQYPTGAWKGGGLAIPVFSIRTEDGLGVGEFTDIKPLVDWAEEIGLRMLQILPVNDTMATNSWADSYPYAAISVFALHPLYLHLDSLDPDGAIIDPQELQSEKEKLNALPQVDYEAVLQLKLRLARQVFEARRATFLEDASFKSFLEANRHWLRPYAVFSYLRDHYGTVDYKQWGDNKECTTERLEALSDPEAPEFAKVAFYYFLQYHLDQQLHEAAEYARSKGVLLKGDIPIGIYRYSVDAWVAPRLYNMDCQAGAPPDPFSDTGQNWGFPTYDWNEMAKDDYRWWRQRLQQLSRYFDAFRIDHILGFFRIWEIPYEQIEGLMGRFNPALPVTRDEFEQRAIPFDYERFVEPYLPDHLIRQQFGGEADAVIAIFLEEKRPGIYQFKESLNSQRSIQEFLAREDNADYQHWKQPLFDLVANLLFFEEPGSNHLAFHPRIKMQETDSFRELDPLVQQRLQDLYIDYYYRRQEDFWRESAMRKLPSIKQATNMLICGEDLGMVPDCVPGVMDELGILSLEIQRMSKNPQTEFLKYQDIPYLSVCSPSTHDMPPLRAWWEESESDQIRRFYQEELGFQGEPPESCEPWVIERILRQHLYWPSMWAVFPLQDLVAMDDSIRHPNPFSERINIPSNPKHYWRYRFHLTVKELRAAKGFNGRLRYMLEDARRF